MPTITELQKKKCKPCKGGSEPLRADQAVSFLGSLPGWNLSEDGKSIGKQFLMNGFSEAAELIRDIARIADAEDHHPDIHLTGYRKLLIECSTHAVKGLSENDFILAAKIEGLPKKLKPA